jgi:dTMP kinase
MSGLFITIEGGEGVGKSTQAARLVEKLRALGETVVQTREPGGTSVGDRIRALLLEPGVEMAGTTELLLYQASRAELVARVIAPALERGDTVVCDRFFDSTSAYQAFGRGLGPETVTALNLSATGGITPDITVLLTLELGEAMRRATASGADRMEGESVEFHRRVIEGFETLAASDPVRIVRVDAAGDPDEVASRVWEAVTAHPAFGRSLGGPALP